MSSPTSASDALEQRLLAAIVFTDVAGFSRRVQVEEAVTLKLLERDFVAMRAFAAMHSGRVIKSTGDGLLLFFTSAVQAVEWALKTQRHFADQAAELPTEEILKHRVGIHLGDVIMTGGDVMGDGVNIAARVQAEAPAGGICVSGVVYGVVKNKMKLDVTKLELRQLKNIAEPVQIYRLLLDAPTQRLQSEAPMRSTLAAEAPVPTSAWKKWAIAGGIVVVLGGVGFFLFQAHREYESELAGSQGAREALGAAMRAGAAEPATTSEPTNSSSVATAPAATKPRAESKSADPFDFAKLAVDRSPAAAKPPEEQVTQAASRSVATLDAWVPQALEHYTAQAPLAVQPLRPTFRSSVVYVDEKHLWFQVGGARQKRDWPDLSAVERGSIIAALVCSSSSTPRDVVRGAEAYAYLNRLPEMAELLLRERSGR